MKSIIFISMLLALSVSVNATNIKVLDVGDTIYKTSFIGGVFRPEKATVVRIDYKNNRVKIRYTETGETAWVASKKLYNNDELLYAQIDQGLDIANDVVKGSKIAIENECMKDQYLIKVERNNSKREKYCSCFASSIVRNENIGKIYSIISNIENAYSIKYLGYPSYRKHTGCAVNSSPAFQFDIGIALYNYHEKTHENTLPEVVKWLRLASNSGYSKAQTMLGLMYLEGSGVQKNETEGYKWIERAANGGDPDARKILWQRDRHKPPF